jgi:putative flippase GtrA
VEPYFIPVAVTGRLEERLVEVHARGRLIERLVDKGYRVSPNAPVELYTADPIVLAELGEEPATIIVEAPRLLGVLAGLVGLPTSRDGIVAARCLLEACGEKRVRPGFKGVLRILLDMMLYSEIGRMTRFAIVGASGIPVNLAVWLLLVRVLGLAGRGGVQGYALPDFLASEAAILWNFAWNEGWTFSDLELSRKPRDIASRLARYNIISLVGVGLLVVIHGALMGLGLGDLAAYLLSIFLVFVYNYAFSRILAWRGSPVSF